MAISKKFEALGTIIEVKIFTNYVREELSYEEIFEEISKELNRIEEKYSRFKDDSLITKINSNIGKWIEIDLETIELISKSLNYYDQTEGFFDISVKKILDDIGYDKNYSFEKKLNNNSNNQKKHLIHRIKNKILNTLKIESLKKSIRLDKKNSKLLLKKEIDFGGIGKGYALDKVSELIESKTKVNYYINAGGDIRVKGEWTILLENPDDSKNMLGKITIRDCAIASSAANRRKWGNDGKNHHLINPKTKKSADDMKAVFVMAKNGTDADVYSTSFFVAGFLDAIRLSKKLHTHGIEVMFISKDNKYYVSSGFKAELFGEEKQSK